MFGNDYWRVADYKIEDLYFSSSLTPSCNNLRLLLGEPEYKNLW